MQAMLAQEVTPKGLDMVIYNCQTCKKENRCSLQNDYARHSLFAFGHDTDVPDCQWYQPDNWRGVEGVIETHHVQLKWQENIKLTTI